MISPSSSYRESFNPNLPLENLRSVEILPTYLEDESVADASLLISRVKSKYPYFLPVSDKRITRIKLLASNSLAETLVLTSIEKV